MWTPPLTPKTLEAAAGCWAGKHRARISIQAIPPSWLHDHMTKCIANPSFAWLPQSVQWSPSRYQSGKVLGLSWGVRPQEGAVILGSFAPVPSPTFVLGPLPSSALPPTPPSPLTLWPAASAAVIRCHGNLAALTWQRRRKLARSS